MVSKCYYPGCIETENLQKIYLKRYPKDVLFFCKGHYKEIQRGSLKLKEEEEIHLLMKRNKDGN